MLVVSMATVLESCSRRSRWSLLGWTEPLNESVLRERTRLLAIHFLTCVSEMPPCAAIWWASASVGYGWSKCRSYHCCIRCTAAAFSDLRILLFSLGGVPVVPADTSESLVLLPGGEALHPLSGLAAVDEVLLFVGVAHSDSLLMLLACLIGGWLFVGMTVSMVMLLALL